jgi:hypothetical protein
MSRRFLKPLSVGLFAIAGCASVALGGCASMDTMAVARASRDFSCTREQTLITDQFGSIYRIEGCGFAATYECREGSDLRISCTALNDDAVATRAASGD